jgi:hypothetical protein
VSPQIKETCKTLSEAKAAASRTFKSVTTNLPGKFKAGNYKQLKLIDIYNHEMQNVIKINFLGCTYTRQF